jgi:hypothetical protein
MIVGQKAKVSFIASLPGWDFLSLDAHGRSSGIMMGWKKSSLKLPNSLASPSILFAHFFSNELNSLRGKSLYG